MNPVDESPIPEVITNKTHAGKLVVSSNNPLVNSASVVLAADSALTFERGLTGDANRMRQELVWAMNITTGDISGYYIGDGWKLVNCFLLSVEN
jgi:hypothetical protein